jgi:hypothetical protein
MQFFKSFSYNLYRSLDFIAAENAKQASQSKGYPASKQPSFDSQSGYRY